MGGEFLETLAFIKWPLLVAVLSSLPLSYYGVYLVERRMVFVSVTLAQAAVCGAAAAFFFSFEPRIGALIFVTVVIALLAGWHRAGRGSLPEDTVLGIFYVVLGGMAVVILSKTAMGGLDETTLLFGSLLGAMPSDAALLGGVAALLVLVHLWGYKRFLAVTFDPETSAVLGMRVSVIELIFFAGLGLVLSVSIAQIGVLLSFAYLVLPAAAARSFGSRTRSVFLLAVLIAVAGSVVGTLASIRWDLPTGAAICLALALPLPVAEIWRHRRM